MLDFAISIHQIHPYVSQAKVTSLAQPSPLTSDNHWQSLHFWSGLAFVYLFLSEKWTTHTHTQFLGVGRVESRQTAPLISRVIIPLWQWQDGSIPPDAWSQSPDKNKTQQCLSRGGAVLHISQGGCGEWGRIAELKFKIAHEGERKEACINATDNDYLLQHPVTVFRLRRK